MCLRATAKLLLLIIILIIPVVTIADEGDDVIFDKAFTQFIGMYRQAVNKRSAAELDKIIHPSCLAVRNQNSFSFDFMFKNEFKRTIPEKYRLRVSKLPSDYPSGQCPIIPTHLLQWDFVVENPRTDWTVTRNLIKDNGRWYIVFP